MEQEFQSTPGTQTIDRGAQLLALVLASEVPRALGELAADAGLPKSTASRLLGALERNGLVEQEGRRGAFRAGPVLARFAGRGITARHVVELSQRPMAALAEVTGETINVAMAAPGGVEHLAQIDSRHFLGTSQWVGRRVPYHCTANGKVLLAFSAAGAEAGELDARTSRTIVERAQLAAELQSVRREGFATAVDELGRSAQTFTVDVIVAAAATTREYLRRWFGIAEPRLALCALNPHAGDGGRFGREDDELLAPLARQFGLIGPLPADTVFVRALRGAFDAVIAPYHDVGMTAIKVAAFGRAVNVTLGLPFPRTSPDHGTALDIAGRGIADPSSFFAALRLCDALAVRAGAGHRGAVG